MKAWIIGIVLCMGASVTVAERVICLGGSVTETVWHIGAEEQVVAVDASSTYPPQAAALPRVGYYRTLSTEGLLSLNPDLVLASEDAGPPEVITHLERAGVRVVRVTGEATAEGTIKRIQDIGEALGRVEESRQAAGRIARAMEMQPPSPESPVRVLFIFAHGAGTLNVAGTHTAADEIIALAGGRNAVTAYRGYRPLTAEALVLAEPDVVLITEDGLQRIGGEKTVWNQIPGLAATPAGRAQRLIAMDTQLLLGFGPRLPLAVETLREALYP